MFGNLVYNYDMLGVLRNFGLSRSCLSFDSYYVDIEMTFDYDYKNYFLEMIYYFEKKVFDYMKWMVSYWV